MRASSHILTVVISFVLPSFVLADDSWVGKVVILKETGVKFGHTDPKTGAETYLGTLNQMYYRVLAEQQGWIRVQQHDKKGWILKEKAVPIEQAVEYFTDQIRADPNNLLAYAHRAAALTWKGDIDGALQDYDQAIRINPKMATPWNDRGYAWYNKRDFDRAISDYSKAIEIDPKYVDAYANRATAWLDKGEPDKAIKDFDEVIRQDPGYVDAYSNRGVCWRQKKQFDKALQDFDISLKLDANWISALNGKAWLLATCPDSKFRDGKKAVELATKACEIEEWKNNAFMDTLAAACAEAGQFEDAVKWMTKALSDEEYAKQAGDMGRKMLEQYKQKKPFRDG